MRTSSQKQAKGRLVDMLVCTGSVQVFRCRRDRRAVVAFWVFVGAALAGCILAAAL
jgi:hypothetical protein